MPIKRYPAVPPVFQEVEPARPAHVHIDVKLTTAQASRLAGLLACVGWYDPSEGFPSGPEGAVGMTPAELYPNWFSERLATKVRAITNQRTNGESYPSISFIK